MSTAMTALILSLIALNIGGCLWLIWWTSRKRPGEEAEGATKSHVWDDDLQELNNPLPRWWLNLFFITIVFAIGYLVLYPGVGSFAGTKGWSQASQHDERLASVQAKRMQAFAQFENRGVAELAKDPAAAQMASRLFADNCAGCHGPSAQGAIGFPRLTDQDWLYGGTADNVLHSITHGRAGVMPALGAALDPQTLDDLVALVANWQKPPLPAERLEAAKAKFGVTCAACHGADGKGNQFMGSPNLTDDIWLYGGSEEDIRKTIQFGRQGRMPAHKDMLSEIEIKLLSAYILRISGQAQ